MKAQLVKLVWQLALAGIFLYSAIMKFLGGVHDYAPRSIYEAVVYHRPWLHYALVGGEVALGLWMLTGLWIRKAALAMLLVLLLFSVTIGREIWQTIPLVCGCHVVEVRPGQGPNEIRLGLIKDLGRNVILMVAAAWLWRRRSPSAKEAGHEVASSSDRRDDVAAGGDAVGGAQG
jgi:hypothetical protein